MHSRRVSHSGGVPGVAYEMERKYSVPSNPDSRQMLSGSASEDLHAWSIYRQNLNSDFTDSALGSTDKSPLPYGNFQLRDTTVQSILSHPRYGPKSALGSNMYTYLKFGLPRVFPPNHNGQRSPTPQNRTMTTGRPGPRVSKQPVRGLRDGSSGYDSSDNETAQQYKQNRKYRSDPDFRMQNVHPSYQQGPPGHTHTLGGPKYGAGGGAPRPTNGQWNKNKSISEANLLSHDIYSRHPGANVPYNRRNSVAAEFNHDTIDRSLMNHPIGRPISKAGSDISLMHSRRGGGGSVLRGEPYPVLHDQDAPTNFIYPHLQVRQIEVTSPKNRRMLLLQNISFEIRGGEILAVLATSEVEGKGLLDTIAGLRNPISGDIILNGQNITKKYLKPRVAYAQNNSNLCKALTAYQTLRFHYDLKKPTEKLDHLKIDANDRINVLIEDLGLEQVRNTKVEQMTTSEIRRLNVACHLLLDTDIVVLDQPTRGMDIFDTFFLVEYLRQWANGGSGRIVILTLHPPTYEIFTMLSRVLLISAGRTMFSGKRKDMLPYFSMVDYPCPSFKNPSDYYLDLVTLDDLSAEAMLESSQRIEQLSEVFRRKQEPLTDPGPPTTLPMTTRNANVFKQALVLFTKSMFYAQPTTFIRWTSLFVLSATLSLLTGAVFWDVPHTDPHLSLNDRLGFHYSVMCLVLWPVLLALSVSEIRNNRKIIERDIQDGLYGRFTFIFIKLFLNILPSLFIWLVYLVPSYSMSGLYVQGPQKQDSFYIYIGYMILYLFSIQAFLTTIVYLFPKAGTSTLIASILLLLTFMVTGFPVSRKDLDDWLLYIDYVSPTRWIMSFLTAREYTVEAVTSSAKATICKNKQIQHQDIIVQSCPPPNGTQVLYNFGFLESDQVYKGNLGPLIAILIFIIICFVITIFGFVFNCCRRKHDLKSRKNDSNKP